MRAMALAALLVGGCSVGHVYTVERAALDAKVDPMPAVLVKTGAAVRIQASSIDRTRLELQGDRFRVHTRVPSRMVTAGVVLTLIGSAISIAGTAMFLATSTGDVHTAGLAIAPSAEPIMIAGTVLWIVGLIRHPEQVR